MLRDIFKSVGGIEIYGLISMIIFVVFFALLLLYALSLENSKARDFSRMPLDDDSDNKEKLQDS